MKSKDKITHLTQELVDAYLNGSLDDASMHQVERLMLDSEFDAEAMEGLSQLSQEEREEDIAIIRSSLKLKKSPKQSFKWWQLAAAVALIISVVYILIPRTIQPPSLSESNVPEKSEETVSPSDTETMGDSSDLLALNEVPDREETEAEPLLKKKEVPEVNAEEEHVVTDELALIEEYTAPAEDIEPVSAESRAVIPLTDTVAPTKVTILESADRENTSVGKITGEPLSITDKDGRTIRGRIIMQDGTPLPGVNVLINGTDQGTISDIDGYYQIEIPNDASLVFSLMGMEKQEVTRPAKDQIDVTMEQDAASLSEVVITGTNKSDKTVGARPSIGESEFQKYLEENLQYPESEEEGTVIIRLDISPDGTITDKKVIRSMGEIFDREAMRLIDQGPAWSPALKNGDPVSDRVRVKINFLKND